MNKKPYTFNGREGQCGLVVSALVIQSSTLEFISSASATQVVFGWAYT